MNDCNAVYIGNIYSDHNWQHSIALLIILLVYLLEKNSLKAKERCEEAYQKKKKN